MALQGKQLLPDDLGHLGFMPKIQLNISPTIMGESSNSQHHKDAQVPEAEGKRPGKGVPLANLLEKMVGLWAYIWVCADLCVKVRGHSSGAICLVFWDNLSLSLELTN